MGIWKKVTGVEEGVEASRLFGYQPLSGRAMQALKADESISVRNNAAGLPIVEWNEGSRVPRVCYVAPDLDGVLRFVSWRPLHNELGDRSSSYVMKFIWPPIILGGLISIAINETRNVWGFEWLAVKTFQFAIGGLIGAALGMFPAWLLSGRAERQAVAGGDMGCGHFRAAPWDELEAFSAHVVEAGSPRETQQILATFLGMHSPAVVSLHEWDMPTQLDLSKILTLEFIERRNEHLDRLAAEARRGRSPTANERKKII